MVQEIKYKGLTRLPSDVSSFDGEMEEVYNLFNVNGELRPYVPPEQIGTLSGVLRFVHKNQGWEHLITLDGSEVKAFNYTGTSISALGTIANIYGVTLIKCDAVGNVLIILTDKGLKYLLWKDNEYKYLGDKIPFVKLVPSISNIGWREVGTVSMNKYSSIVESLWNGRELTGNDLILANDFTNDYWAFIEKNYTDLTNGGNVSRPFFVRYAIRLYDGTLINHSMPFLMPFWAGKNNWDFDVKFTEQNVLHQAIYYGKLSITWSETNLQGWEDIISSVDIFVSPFFNGYTNDAKLFYSSMSGPSSLPHMYYHELSKRVFPFPNINMMENLTANGNFYFVKSLSISDLSSNGSMIIDDINHTNLYLQERMTDDFLSHETVIPESSYTYNNKLHLTGIKRRSFRGWGISGIETSYDSMSPATDTVPSTPYLFYPGKAKYVTLITRTPSLGTKRLHLTPHPTLNGSYYIDRNLENISVQSGAFRPGEDDAGSNNGIDASDANKIYVSELSNPFYFPVNSRITLPVGRVIAISSNTEAISAGQFGQFPLFAFTDDGIWALEVSSDGKYLARQPVSREVITNPNVLQMDKYIAFVSKRGLNILSGSSTECITDIVREVNTRSSKVSITSFVVGADTPEVQAKYNTVTIEEYMLSCELAYEYINGQGRIYMINNNFDYCYVFDIMSKSWSKVQGKYRNSVANYPDCYVQNTSGNIFNLASIREGQGDITTMYMTRPIKMEQALFSLKQLAHVGVFNNGDVLTCVYASRDGINYAPIASGRNRLLRISGTPYRYYKVAVIANLQPNETLSSIQLNVEPKFTNRIR